MAGTPIYDKMVADKAKKDAAKAEALKPKKAPVGKETGIKKPTKVTAKTKQPNMAKYKRGTK